MPPSAREIFGLIFWLLFSVLSADEDPLRYFKENFEFPFQSCPFYGIGGHKGTPFSPEKSLATEPTLAFYPLTEEETRLKLQIMFPNMVFKIKIIGTLITVEKCNYIAPRNCTMENEEGVKHLDYVSPHIWNRVSLNLTSQLLEIYIRDRKVMSKSMIKYKQNPKEEIIWQLHVVDSDEKISNKLNPAYLYLVQFQCEDLTQNKTNLRTNPDPDVNDQRQLSIEKPDKNKPLTPLSSAPQNEHFETLTSLSSGSQNEQFESPSANGPEESYFYQKKQDESSSSIEQEENPLSE